jgi:hypothetical protein
MTEAFFYLKQNSYRLNCLTAIFWVAVFAASCSSASNSEGYNGISETYPTGSSQISADNLIAAFDMETRTPNGMLQDFSGHQHHSEIIGTTVVQGIFGGALQFETFQDRVDIPETPLFDLDGPISIALVVRIDTLNLHQHIIAVDDKFVIWINPENHIRFTDTLGSGIESREPVDSGRWYSLVAVMAGTYGTPLSADVIRLYMDGEVVVVDIVGRPIGEPFTWKPGRLHPSDAAYIGFESHQGDPEHQKFQFEGAVDEVLVFSRALTAREVLAHADRSD